MNTENIQSEKLELINWTSQLQDVSLIEKLKKLYLKNKSRSSTMATRYYNCSFERYKRRGLHFIGRIEKSNQI